MKEHICRKIMWDDFNATINTLLLSAQIGRRKIWTPFRRVTLQNTVSKFKSGSCSAGIIKKLTSCMLELESKTSPKISKWERVLNIFKTTSFTGLPTLFQVSLLISKKKKKIINACPVSQDGGFYSSIKGNWHQVDVTDPPCITVAFQLLTWKTKVFWFIL